MVFAVFLFITQLSEKETFFGKKDFSKEISCSVLVAVVDQNWKFFQLYILTIKNTFISI